MGARAGSGCAAGGVGLRSGVLPGGESIELLDNAGNQPGEAFPPFSGDGEDLFDLDRLEGIREADVGDNREGEDSQAGVWRRR